MEILDDKIYCTINEVFTLSYLVPSNARHVEVTYCPYLVAAYDTRTDQLSVYESQSTENIKVLAASYDLKYVYLDMKFTAIGTYNIQIGYPLLINDNVYEVHVLPVLTDLSMIFYEITDTEQLSRMKPGEAYTFEANLLVSGEDESKYKDYLKNYRIGVCNAELDETSQSTILQSMLENAEFSDQAEVNVKTRLTSEFTYDEDYRLIVLITGDFAEGYPNDFTIAFDSLKIYESTPNLIGMQCHHITPIENSISSTENSSIILDSFSSSNTFTFSKLYTSEDDPDEDEDITYGNNQNEAVSGIAVMLDIVETGDVTLLATLTNDKSSIGQKSVILNAIDASETPTTITLGDSDDVWGFDVGDIENIEDWELTLQLLNNTSSSNSITFNNVRIVYYTIPVEHNDWDYLIEETNMGFYGVFMENVDIPTGLNTDIKELEIEGSDINTISRQNIIGKTITLEFSIYDCNLQTSIKLLNKLARLIYNERDAKTNQPIPKVFSTTLYPEKEWEYVCIKEMETEFVQGEIKGKVELYVPSGTYKSVEEITTGAIGYNQGLNKVQPTITIGNFTGDEIILIENNTNQKFIIRDVIYVSEDIITIDCANRTIVQSNPNSDDELDLGGNCDMDNDWFTINKDYNFSCTNATVMKVTYYEGG